MNLLITMESRVKPKGSNEVFEDLPLAQVTVVSSQTEDPLFRLGAQMAIILTRLAEQADQSLAEVEFAGVYFPQTKDAFLIQVDSRILLVPPME